MVFRLAYLGFILVFGMFTGLRKRVARKVFDTRASALLMIVLCMPYSLGLQV